MWLVLTLLLGFYVHEASASFFSGRCFGAYEAIAKITVIPNARLEAARRGLNEIETEEYIARQLRLSFLARESSRASDERGSTLHLLRLYNAALIAHAESPQREVWNRVLLQEYPDAADASRPNGIDTNMLQGVLPSLLSADHPPAVLSATAAVATLNSNLALYRYNVSKALAEVPLNSPIGQKSEQELAKAIQKGEEAYLAQRISIGTGLPPLDSLVQAPAPDAQAARAIFALNRGKELLQDGEVSEGVKRAIKDQIDFMEKYGLAPNTDFWQLILTAKRAK